MKKLLLVTAFVSFVSYAEDNVQKDAVKTPEELCKKFAQYPRDVQYEIIDNVYRLYMQMEFTTRDIEKHQEVMKKVFHNRAHGQDDHRGLTEEESGWFYLLRGFEEHYLALAFMQKGVYTSVESSKFVKDVEEAMAIHLEKMSAEEQKKLSILDQISTCGIPVAKVSDQEVDEAVSILFSSLNGMAKTKAQLRECHTCFAKVIQKQNEEEKK